MTRSEAVREALDAAYKGSVHLPTPEKAAFVQHVLGARLAAASLGLKDTRTLQNWARGGPIRGRADEHRLQVLYQATAAIEALYSPAVAAAFLRGTNRELGDRAPMLVIADEDPADVQSSVIDAVEALLEA